EKGIVERTDAIGIGYQVRSVLHRFVSERRIDEDVHAAVRTRADVAPRTGVRRPRGCRGGRRAAKLGAESAQGPLVRQDRSMGHEKSLGRRKHYGFGDAVGAGGDDDDGNAADGGGFGAAVGCGAAVVGGSGGVTVVVGGWRGDGGLVRSDMANLCASGFSILNR